MEEGAEGGEEGQAGPPDRLISDDEPSDHEPSDPAGPGRGTSFVRRRWPEALVIAWSVWLTRAFWMPGGFVVGFDTYAYSGPNVEVTVAAFRDRRLPLVNDLIFAGVPHLGNPNAGVFYPANLVALVFDTNRAMGIVVALHFLVLGLGMLVLCRRLRFSPLGATVAAVAAVAAGATLTKSVQYEQIQVLAWAPLLAATIHATLTSARRLESAAALAAVTAAVTLAGHPQLVYETMIFAAACTVGFAIGGRRWRRLPWVAIGVGLGVMMALPQLAAVLAATTDSAITGGRTLAELEAPGLSMLFKDTARAVLGTVQDQDPAVFAGGFESIGFIGVVVAVLAVIGLMRAVASRRTRPWAIALAVLGAVSLVWTYGPGNVLFTAAYELLPGFDLARASARWMVLVALVAAIFAGAGADAVARGVRREQLAVAVVGVAVVAAMVAFGPFVVFDRRSATIWAVTASIVIVVLAVTVLVTGARRNAVVRGGAVALLALGAVELTLMAMHSIPPRLRDDVAFTDHSTATSEWLSEQTAGSTIALTDDGVPVDYQVPGMRPNTNVVFDVPSPDGYDGGVQITERWAESLRRYTPDPPIELPLRNSLELPINPDEMARLGVRFILLDLARPADEFVPGWTGPVISDAQFAVYENPRWIGDAVAWPKAEAVVGSAADTLRENTTETTGVALVDTDAAALDCRADCDPVGVEVDFGTPEHIVVRTDLGEPAVVSVARQALPGWEVTIDGERADEVVVDGLLLGASVPAGEHSVEWRYRSPWLGWTIVLSLVAVAATVALFVAGTVRRRADSSNERIDRSIEQLDI